MMKSSFYTLLLLVISVFALEAQVTFVSASATGANDGSSWANAYNSLDAALDAGVTGQIWITGGKYKPGGATPDTSSMFLVNSAVDIYGGFSGTETAITQRTGSAISILSGDLMDNDNGMMDSTLRADNVRHVVFVNSGIGSAVTLDGLTIEGGNTLDDGNAPFVFRAGGGVYSESALTLNNCVFRNNFGRSGGGVSIDNTGGRFTDAVTVTNCTFNNNSASSQSAGLVMYEVAEATITGCTFRDNSTNRGCLYPVDCGNVNIDNCTFMNNTNSGGFGAGMFVWQTMHLSLNNCEFRGNTSFQAAGMYYDAREIAFSDPSLAITDCVFQDNRATGGFGGAFSLWQGTNITISGCEFNRNSANSAGAFTYNGSESPQFNPNNLVMTNCEFGANEAVDFGGGSCYFTASSFTIDDCTFLGNVAPSGGAIFSTGNNRSYIIRNTFFGLNNGGFGAAMTAYGTATTANISNCTFLNNSADNGGGAINCGFKANVMIDNCSFQGGMAAVGGAVSVQNDSTTVRISNSLLIGNEASNTGGGFFTYGSSDTNVTLFNCEIAENTAGVGGGVHFGTGTDIDTSKFLIDRCIIRDNNASTQGGAVNISNKDGVIVNTLIYNNIAESVGTGGAISHNASGNFTSELEIINSTITQNLGVLSNGIAAWTDTIGASSIVVKNTILDNGNDYEVEDGTPTIVSAGGNFSSDVFLDLILGLEDIIGVDPLFEDQNNLDFHLKLGSPCIDAGVSEGSPEKDLDGAQRDGMPDIGAYEYGAMVSTNDIGLYENFEVQPNPARDVITIDLPEHLASGQMKIYNMKGQVVYHTNISGQRSAFNVSELADGQYLLLINGDAHYRSLFVKI